MKRKILLPIAFIVSICFAGCALPHKMYYFGDYSQTLYSLVKNQTEEALFNHKQELEKILSKSEVLSLPVPPGIYAELGYINLKANNSKKAIELFQAESQLYPESKHLMERLIQSAKSRNNSDSEGETSDQNKR